MKSILILSTGLLLFTSCLTDSTLSNLQIEGELKQWHKVTLTFAGPDLSEESQDNPFLNYQMEVDFKKGNTSYTIPGYFAADGRAAETSAQSGNKWRVHFNPDEPGKWEYTVSFKKGPSIASQQTRVGGESIYFDGAKGTLEIEPSDKSGRDFRAHGRIQLDETGRFLQFAGSENYFVKGGADSPENFLAYHEFDSTYRHSAEAREGEADPTASLHQYAAHIKDWKEGNPTWQGGKGKGMIGGLNYLADQGMNSVYFLVMNINGDGKDVWPYIHHDSRDRFDCSKLDQWEMVFDHMEQLGIMMHLVTQETENEKLLDNGDTGPERRLFYRELVARFAHHNGIVWNLGEENGPANFSPDGQNPEQQKAMATALKQIDPYQHPVVIHTHSWKGQKEESLPALLGHQPLDGLSFQVDKREHVHEEIIKWQTLAEESGHPWMVQMDEIGMWHTGVMPDAVNPNHDTIRQQVLWGSLMAGAAGVEWYFGARYPHNDLTCEDWRSRENIWKQTKIALDLFNQIPFWQMENKDELINVENAYCLAKPGTTYVAYFPIGVNDKRSLDLSGQSGNYSVQWYNPREGGKLEQGSVEQVVGPGIVDLGNPPDDSSEDWVALIESE